MLLVMACGGVVGVGTSGAMAQGQDSARLVADETNRLDLSDASLQLGGSPGMLAPAPEMVPLHLTGYMQFRYIYNHRQDQPNDDKNTYGFQDGRVKLVFTGNVFSPDIDYLVRFRFVTNTGVTQLDYAYTNFNLGDGFKLRVGQFMPPMVREEIITDYVLLFAERSAMDAYFTVGYTQGVQLSYENDSIQLFGVVSDGIATQNTDFNSPKEADWATTGRVNWKLAGDWKQNAEFTGFREAGTFAMLGAAGTYQQGGQSGYTADVDKWQVMADAQVKGDGWNTFLCGAYRGTRAAGGPTFSDYGVLLQGGFFVSESIELIAGWDITIPDSARATNKDFNEVRAGFNYYISPRSHACVFTANVCWLPNAQAQSIVPANPSFGILSSNADNQFVLMTQLQVVF
jgi:hypothetical protein